MDDRELDKILDSALDDARRTYHAPPAPDIETIWRNVEARAFAAPGRRTGGGHTWRVAGMAAAASLLIGVAAGRWSAGKTATAPATMAAAPALPTVSAPYQQATEDVLGRAAVLIAALRTTDARGAVNGQLTAQATSLLGSTRLLIDSPAATDPRMRSLLLDLELTLAQIARIQPARGETDLNLINDAVAERDIVPRIRSAVVDISGGY
ncbi:MAG TPA: hypothetical protein VG916_09590 [Gemmatimonadaceae bacterium]|nr:hypothetical protein [Gemmatimonadaceae bacterium]